MATRTSISYVCDLPGHDGEADAARMVKFGLGGEEYEVDACESHAEQIEAAVGAFTTFARKTTAEPASRRAPRTPADSAGYQQKKEHGEENAAVREWAARQLADTGDEMFRVSDRGRISGAVRAAYNAR
jgi:Lsr2